MKPYFYYKLLEWNHFQVIREAARKTGAHATVDMNSFKLSINCGGQVHTLHPQFINIDQRRRVRSSKMGMNTVFFNGWSPSLPYPWELADNKLAFKALLQQADLPTPVFSSDPGQPMQQVLVKNAVNQDSLQFHGPYANSSERAIDVGAGDYYEQFIPGKITKTWFWNQTPVCTEILDFAQLRGDGRHTIKELAISLLRELNRPPFDAGADIKLLHDYLDYQGKSLDTVLADKETLPIDYRYESQFLVPALLKTVYYQDEPRHALLPGLTKLGQTTWAAATADLRRGAVYSVDAIMDDAEQLHFLSLDRQPFVHPEVYPLMIQDWAGGQGKTRAAM